MIPELRFSVDGTTEWWGMDFEIFFPLEQVFGNKVPIDAVKDDDYWVFTSTITTEQRRILTREFYVCKKQ